MLSLANFATAENLHRNKAAQFSNAQCGNTLANLLKLHAIVEREREVALNSREFRQRFVTYLLQIVLVEAVAEGFSDGNIQPQIARSSHIGMKMAQLRY